MGDAAVQSVKSARRIGKEHYEAYKHERIETCSKSIYAVVSKNKLTLFRSKNKVTTCKVKLKVVSLKEDCRLYLSLYVACQTRNGDLSEFFPHENHSYPPAISENGKIRKTNKSDFLSCLQAHGNAKEESPKGLTAKIIDGAAIVQMTTSKNVKTYGEYSLEVFRQQILKSFTEDSICRLGVIFDRYVEPSLKSEARERRGRGIRIAVKRTTPMC